MSYIDMINKRTSIRSFLSDIPDEKILGMIKKIVSRQRKGPFGKSFSFSLIDSNDEKFKEIGKLTSYGIIKGARFYFGGYSEPDNRAIIDFGYCFQEVLLDLTKLNLGTCWLGGTFGRGYIAKILSLPEGKVIPAISPVAYCLEKRGVLDKLVRFSARSSSRKGYKKLFFNYDEKDKLQPLIYENIGYPVDTILESVRVGPSASNKQPWRLVFQDSIIHFYWDFDRKYNALIRGFNIQALDMGIALCHFKKASEELGFCGRFSYSDPHFEKIPWKYVLSWKVDEYGN